jgi:transposase-like protein
MGRKRVNKYPIAFRQMAMERMKTCGSVSALADELGVHRTVLYHWQRQQEAGHDGTPSSAIRGLRKEVRDLKRLLAEKTVEADFFRSQLIGRLPKTLFDFSVIVCHCHARALSPEPSPPVLLAPTPPRTPDRARSRDPRSRLHTIPGYGCSDLPSGHSTPPGLTPLFRRL